MAIFSEYDPCGRERSSEDRRRHKELVEESIKRNIGNIISEESIIGQSGNKKIRVPVKGIREYRFIYGSSRKGAATGDGDEKRGDVVGDDSGGSIYGHGGAGNIEGEDIYETEITIEELVDYLFDDLNLPDLTEGSFPGLNQSKDTESWDIRRRVSRRGWQYEDQLSRRSKENSHTKEAWRKFKWIRAERQESPMKRTHQCRTRMADSRFLKKTSGTGDFVK